MFQKDNITPPSVRAFFPYGVSDKPRIVGGFTFCMENQDLIGKVFGYIVPTSYSHSERSHRYYNCVCIKCGTVTKKIGSNLKRYVSSKAGKGCRECFKKEMKSFALRHGMDKTPEYRCWAAMKNRCLNNRHKQYSHYGGRGITICDRWIESFNNFYADMGLKPSPKHSLDRIDNNGNYEPNNCKWSTSSEQNTNRRSAFMVNYNGETIALRRLTNNVAVPYDVLYNRIKRLNWPIEMAISTPYKPRKKRTSK